MKANGSHVIRLEQRQSSEVRELLRLGIKTAWLVDDSFLFPGTSKDEAWLLAQDWYMNYGGDSYFKDQRQFIKLWTAGVLVGLINYA